MIEPIFREALEELFPNSNIDDWTCVAQKIDDKFSVLLFDNPHEREIVIVNCHDAAPGEDPLLFILKPEAIEQVKATLSAN